MAPQTILLNLSHVYQPFIKKISLGTLPNAKSVEPLWTGHQHGGGHMLQCSAIPQSGQNDAEMYKRLTFLSLIPVPVLQQAVSPVSQAHEHVVDVAHLAWMSG